MPSIYPFDPTDLETFTVVTNPVRTYTSSSTQGSTGSIYVYPRHSLIQKDIQPDSSFTEAAHDDADLSSLLHQVQMSAKVSANAITHAGALVSGSLTSLLTQYMAGCATQGQAERLKVKLDIVRFSPPPAFNSNTLRKLIIKDQLNTFYRPTYPTAHWAYTNYNTLNFFTASMVPTSSVLLYPNIGGGNGGLVVNKGHASGTYTPSGSFSFDFYINPRYQQDAPNKPFKAGTILHLSSTFALSLVTGSGVDYTGRSVGFRLQLQLSQSADIAPSTAVPGPYPSDLIFLSNDNSLQWNHWHHVVVRWGTNQINNGVGTFNVDGLDVGTFTVPSSTISPAASTFSQTSSLANPDVMCLGNFYEGPNTNGNPMGAFFAFDPANRDGLQVMYAEYGVAAPPSYFFRHPLNAELHDVAIRRCYMSDTDIAFSASIGPTFLDNTFSFYVPPFFVEQSPYRQFVGDHGGLLITPFEEIDGASTTPFSVALSFGVAGHYINLENFGKDLGSQVFPLLHHLTGVAIQTSTSAETCNDFLYSQPFVAKRNLTILPCDDGNFVPSFQLLVSEGLARAVDDLGLDELSFINLDNMISTATLMFGAGAFDDGTQPDVQVNAFANIQLGATPETPFTAAGPATLNYINTAQSGSDVEFGAPLTVFQRTQDPSSNEVVVFDISNLYYGFRISPGTLTFSEPDLMRSSLLGSQHDITQPNTRGPISINLADDGRGNVYRADCLTPQATWNSVGNVYYDEGLVLLKSPHLYFYGLNQFGTNFRGEQHVHVMKLDAFAPSNQLNSSSNPNYASVPPTGYPNDPEDNFVYITNLYFHDRDLNVVMKTALAQPIAKRPGDKVLFKIKYDF